VEEGPGDRESGVKCDVHFHARIKQLHPRLGLFDDSSTLIFDGWFDVAETETAFCSSSYVCKPALKV
jgi:hypothetical protein